MAEDKNTERKSSGGAFKRLVVMLLFIVMAYLSLHIYFIWQPADKTTEFSDVIMNAEVAGVKVFPSIMAYDVDGIDARKEILDGRPVRSSPLPERLNNAIESNQPITFSEFEVNVWLRNRLQVKQRGLLAPYANVRGVWVNFIAGENDAPGEIEYIIERELPEGINHVVSLFMKFEMSNNGFRIHRHASHIGQVKLPGGFARLVMPSFSHMAEELTEELKLYKDDSLNSAKPLKIHKITIGDGVITLDPRLSDENAM
jgi:hypothetical protein